MSLNTKTLLLSPQTYLHLLRDSTISSPISELRNQRRIWTEGEYLVSTNTSLIPINTFQRLVRGRRILLGKANARACIARSITELPLLRAVPQFTPVRQSFRLHTQIRGPRALRNRLHNIPLLDRRLCHFLAPRPRSGNMACDLRVRGYRDDALSAEIIATYWESEAVGAVL